MDPALKEELYILVMEIIEDIDEPLKYDEDSKGTTDFIRINRAKTNLNTLKTKIEWL
tara:strand:- start:2618 stop:2788 length:171 start_codon:yes stop_codon:yes gene_type:complete